MNPDDVWRLIEENPNQFRYQTTLENTVTRTTQQSGMAREIQELKEFVLKLGTNGESKTM